MLWATVLTAAALRRPSGTSPPPRRVVRLTCCALAVRQVAEIVVSLRATDRRPSRWAVHADALHAASMLPVAALDASLRRPALRSAAVSAVLALFGR
jgi:hypothetical protein